MQATPNNEKWQDPTAPSIPPLRCESISIIQYDIHTRCWQPPTEHQTLTCTFGNQRGKKGKNGTRECDLHQEMCMCLVCVNHLHVGRDFTLYEHILSLLMMNIFCH